MSKKKAVWKVLYAPCAVSVLLLLMCVCVCVCVCSVPQVLIKLMV